MKNSPRKASSLRAAARQQAVRDHKASAAARRLARLEAFVGRHRRALIIAAAWILVLSLVTGLFLYLRPDTWHHYTDQLAFRHQARKVDPRFVLWEQAAPAAGTFNVPARNPEPCVAPDGATMVFTREREAGNADLFFSRWNGRAWSEMEPARALNSKFNEVGPAFSRDGKFLFFSTDRPGGRGGYDIWVARWDGADFAWPLPLTLMVNSKFDDLCAEPSAINDKLYFASNRPERTLTKEEEALKDDDLRAAFRDEDFDIYVANRIPAGVTNRAVERAMSMLYSLRNSALSDTNVMLRLGGTPESETAVDRALSWLAGAQGTNGNWAIADFGGLKGHDVAATAFAMLAFFGRGERHDRPCTYSNTVAHGLNWLLQTADPLTGDLRGRRPVNQAMYDQSIATLALAEAYGVTKDENIYVTVQTVIDFLVDAQNADDGGWRYEPNQAGDTSVSGWAIMALKSAEMTGLFVPPETFEGIRHWLTSVAGGTHDGIYSYQPGGNARNKRPAMIATGYFCSQLMGLSPNTRSAFETAAYLGKEGVDVNDIYYAYYGTLCSYQTQGPLWRTWYAGFHDRLLKAQAKDGSWMFSGGHASRMGKVICTALATLCLQAHYRYTPLYGLGYEPPEKPKRFSQVGEGELPMPEYRRAKRMNVLCSPADDLHVSATEHGDFLYFASDRPGGLGGLDLYRTRISTGEPAEIVNLGPVINSPADDTAPCTRMAGFNLIYATDRDADDPGTFTLYSSLSRRVFRRHVRGTLPALTWLFDRYHGRIFGILAAMLVCTLFVFVPATGRRRRHRKGEP